MSNDTKDAIIVFSILTGIFLIGFGAGYTSSKSKISEAPQPVVQDSPVVYLQSDYTDYCTHFIDSQSKERYKISCTSSISIPLQEAVQLLIDYNNLKYVPQSSEVTKAHLVK